MVRARSVSVPIIRLIVTKHLEERRQYRREWYQRMRQDPYWLEMDKKRKKAVASLLIRLRRPQQINDGELKSMPILSCMLSF
jgi:hypothetical protein